MGLRRLPRPRFGSVPVQVTLALPETHGASLALRQAEQAVLVVVEVQVGVPLSSIMNISLAVTLEHASVACFSALSSTSGSGVCVAARQTAAPRYLTTKRMGGMLA